MTGAPPKPVLLNNAEEAAAFLANTPRAWGFLMAVELGHLPLGKAAPALGMDVGDFYLLQAAAGAKCKELGRMYEFPT
jgi:hypothetical protein